METPPWDDYISYPDGTCIVWNGKQWVQQLFMTMECMQASNLEGDAVKFLLGAGPMHGERYVWTNGQELRKEIPLTSLYSWLSRGKVPVTFTLPGEGHQLILTGILRSTLFIPLYESEEKAQLATPR